MAVSDFLARVAQWVPPALVAALVVAPVAAFGQSNNASDPGKGDGALMAKSESSAPAAKAGAVFELPSEKLLETFQYKIKRGMSDEKVIEILKQEGHQDGLPFLKAYQGITKPFAEWRKQNPKADRMSNQYAAWPHYDPKVQQYVESIRYKPDEFACSLSLLYFYRTTVHMGVESTIRDNQSGFDLASAAKGLTVAASLGHSWNGIEFKNVFSDAAGMYNRFSNGASDADLKAAYKLPTATKEMKDMIVILFPKIDFGSKVVSKPPGPSGQ